MHIPKSFKFIVNFVYFLIVYMTLGSLFSFFINYISPTFNLTKHRGIIFLEICLEFGITGLIIYYITATSNRLWVPFKIEKDVEYIINSLAQNFFMITIFLFQKDLQNKLQYLLDVDNNGGVK